jgi:hypothetical protein
MFFYIFLMLDLIFLYSFRSLYIFQYLPIFVTDLEPTIFIF